MRYASATELVPQPHVVAGVRLRPFCLGHLLLLKKLGSPIIEGDEPSIDDLCVAIAICGMTYEAGIESLSTGSFSDEVKSWQKKLHGPWYRPVTPDWDEIENRFAAYLKEGSDMPPTWTHPQTGGITISAPWECLMRVKLLKVGLSESEIMNGYLPARWYDYLTACEIEAAEVVKDAAKWRKTFYTKADAEALN